MWVCMLKRNDVATVEYRYVVCMVKRHDVATLEYVGMYAENLRHDEATLEYVSMYDDETWCSHSGVCGQVWWWDMM